MSALTKSIDARRDGVFEQFLCSMFFQVLFSGVWGLSGSCAMVLDDIFTYRRSSVSCSSGEFGCLFGDCYKDPRCARSIDGFS